MENAKILIVDDEECMVGVFRRMLSKKGFKSENIVSVENGEDAITIAEKSDFDIILMDIKMPGIGGLEALSAIRTMKKYKDVPILAVTGLTLSKDRKNCIEAGATEYISKPVFDEKAFIDNLFLKISANKNKPIKAFFEKNFR